MTTHQVRVESFATRDSWLKRRSGSLGGSDIPDLFGAGYSSLLALWLRKRAEFLGAEVEPESFNPRFAMGHAVEPVLALCAEQHLGLPIVRLQNIVYSRPDLPRFHVSPDALAVTARPKKVHVQKILKRAVALSSFKTAFPGLEDWAGDEIHPYAVIQSQAEMLVSGLKTSFITVARGFGSIQTKPLEFNEQFGDLIAERVFEFWASIANNQRPAPQGEMADSEAIRALYRKSEPRTIVLASDWKERLAQWQSYNVAIEDLETLREKIKQEAMLEMGEAEIGLIPGSEKSLAWKTQIANHPAKPAAQTESRPLRIINTPKPKEEKKA